MNGHLDAAGVGLILTGLYTLIVVFVDRRHTRTADAIRATYKALRRVDHAAYWRLHHRYVALCSAGVTVEQAAAQAEHLTAPDQPIPYDLIDPADRAAYLPTWTTGPVSHDLGTVTEAIRTVRQEAR